MESNKVKELREKYGIMDSRNEYTEEQILELSQRKLYYIRPYGDSNKGIIHIEYNQVPGYVSNDEKSCIFIKNKDITQRDDNYYYPVKLIKDCTEIKEGIYHEEVDDVIFCTTEEIQFCLEYEQKYVKKNIQEEIAELEKKILDLKKLDIEINQIY